MAHIVENGQGRRMIRLSAADVLSVVNQYSILVNTLPCEARQYETLHQHLSNTHMYLPEDIA